LEINLRDSAEFENWKETMKKKDKIEELELLQRRKVEMELARESAMKATEDHVKSN